MALGNLIGRVGQALFFPQACVLCHRCVLSEDARPLCRYCFTSLQPLDNRLCGYCGIPLPGDVTGLPGICSECRRHQKPYNSARAFGSYQGNLRTVIWKFKFEGYRRLAHPLADLLQFTYERLGWEISADWVIPIPLHPRRRRERGFDQTLLLARLLGANLGVPVFKGLKRIRYTQPQSGLNLEERRRNLQQAFALNQAELLADCGIILVDDVMTSGTTVSVVSDLIRNNSMARSITVLTVARVPLLHRQPVY